MSILLYASTYNIHKKSPIFAARNNAIFTPLNSCIPWILKHSKYQRFKF